MNTAGRTTMARPRGKIGSTLVTIVYSTSKWLSYLSMTAAAVMMLVIAADVFMRRAFNSPIFGSYDVIKVLLVIIVFCAVPYVMRVKEHVEVDSVARLFQQKVKRIINGISRFLSLLIVALICWRSIEYGLDMQRVQENLVLLKIPLAPFIFVIAFGYAIFFLVVLVQFILTLVGIDDDIDQVTVPPERLHG